MIEPQPSQNRQDGEKKSKRSWRSFLLGGAAATTVISGGAAYLNHQSEGELQAAALAAMRNRPVQAVEQFPTPQDTGANLSKSPETEKTVNLLQRESTTKERAIKGYIDSWLLGPDTVREIAALEQKKPVIFPKDDYFWDVSKYSTHLDEKPPFFQLLVVSEHPENEAPLYSNTSSLTLTGAPGDVTFGEPAVEVGEMGGRLDVFNEAYVSLGPLHEQLWGYSFGVLTDNNGGFSLVASLSDASTSGYGYYSIPLELPPHDSPVGVSFSDLQRDSDGVLSGTISYTLGFGSDGGSKPFSASLQNKKYDDFG